MKQVMLMSQLMLRVSLVLYSNIFTLHVPDHELYAEDQ